MNHQQLAALLERQRDNTLSPQQQHELDRYLADHPEAMAWWQETQQFDRGLAQSITARLERSRLPEPAQHQLRQRLRRSPYALRRIQRAFVVLAIAINMFVGVVVWGALLRQSAPAQTITGQPENKASSCNTVVAASTTAQAVLHTPTQAWTPTPSPDAPTQTAVAADIFATAAFVTPTATEEPATQTAVAIAYATFTAYYALTPTMNEATQAALRETAAAWTPTPTLEPTTSPAPQTATQMVVSDMATFTAREATTIAELQATDPSLAQSAIAQRSATPSPYPTVTATSFTSPENEYVPTVPNIDLVCQTPYPAP